jgi:gas vesicle protein
VFFGGTIFGIMIGFVVEWMREYKLRSESSRKTRELKGIQRKLQQLKDEKYENQDDVLALLEDTIKETKRSAPLM